ncbi:hypothetical protein ALC56_11434, partial [Trachymyrmex septentrionalis]
RERGGKYSYTRGSAFVSSWRIRRAEETIPGCIISELPSAPREKERQKSETECVGIYAKGERVGDKKRAGTIRGG